MKKTTLFFILYALGIIPLMAQNDSKEKSGSFGANNFFFAGHTAVSAAFDTGTAAIGDAGFSAVFLYKLSDKLFVESELEVATGDGAVEVGLEHAKLVYSVCKNLNFYAGRWVPKFGMYRGRIGESFINKFATDPVGFGDGGIGAMEETGVGAAGGLSMGPSKINYDVWVTNGPQLLTDVENAGQFDYEAYTENNKNKAYGGRLGFLPFSNSCLELGFSFENANNTLDQNSVYTYGKNVGVTMYALDMNFYHAINPIKSTVRISGEYKVQNVGRFDYSLVGDSIIVDDANNPGSTMQVGMPAFQNNANAWYGTISLRPSGVNNAVLRNFEVAYRYSQFSRPNDAPWGGKTLMRSTVAIDYWLKWNCVAKLCYETQTDTPNRIYAQMVYGF